MFLEGQIKNQCTRDVFRGRNLWMKVRLTYFKVCLVEKGTVNVFES